MKRKDYMLEFKGGRFKETKLRNCVIAECEGEMDHILEMKKLLRVSDDETFGFRSMRMDFQDTVMIRCYKFEKGDITEVTQEEYDEWEVEANV